MEVSDYQSRNKELGVILQELVGKNVTIDIVGVINTQISFLRFEWWTEDEEVVLSGDNTERTFRLDTGVIESIECVGCCGMQIDLELDNGLTVQIYDC